MSGCCMQWGTSQSPDKDTAAVLQGPAHPVWPHHCCLQAAEETPCRQFAADQGLTAAKIPVSVPACSYSIASVAADEAAAPSWAMNTFLQCLMFIPSRCRCVPAVAGKFCTKSWFTTTADHTAAGQSCAGTQTRTKPSQTHKSKLPDRTNFGGSGKHFLFLQSSTSIPLYKVTVVLCWRCASVRQAINISFQSFCGELLWACLAPPRSGPRHVQQYINHLY